MWCGPRARSRASTPLAADGRALPRAAARGQVPSGRRSRGAVGEQPGKRRRRLDRAAVQPSRLRRSRSEPVRRRCGLAGDVGAGALELAGLRAPMRSTARGELDHVGRRSRPGVIRSSSTAGPDSASRRTVAPGRDRSAMLRVGQRPRARPSLAARSIASRPVATLTGRDLHQPVQERRPHRGRRRRSTGSWSSSTSSRARAARSCARSCAGSATATSSTRPSAPARSFARCAPRRSRCSTSTTPATRRCSWTPSPTSRPRSRATRSATRCAGCCPTTTSSCCWSTSARPASRSRARST